MGVIDSGRDGGTHSGVRSLGSARDLGFCRFPPQHLSARNIAGVAFLRQDYFRSECSRLNGRKPSWNRTKLVRALIVVFALVASLLAGAWLYGAYRWNFGTQELRARLDGARVPIRPRTVDLSELDGLLAPVQRYFRVVLNEGQPMVAGVRVKHGGTFNMGETADQWKPFTSDQEVVTRRPGFDWDGRVAMMPGVPVGCTTPT